jgi:hypothetical protein
MCRRALSGFHVVAILVIYLVLLGGAVWAAWWVTTSSPATNPPQDFWKNFGSTATVGVTAVSAFMAAWVSLRNLAVQSRTSVEVERVKRVLDKRVPAHGDLFSAARNYYRLLAPLESGEFNWDSIEGAETRMKDAEGLTVYVSEEYARYWMRFWQKARYLKEKVNRDVPHKNERIQLWRDNVKDLADELNKMETMARALFVT